VGKTWDRRDDGKKSGATQNSGCAGAATRQKSTTRSISLADSRGRAREAILRMLRKPVPVAKGCDEDLWVFGYGSLIWRPGFEFVESALAWVHGYHRSLCIYSHVHRGTPAQPGLVLGLDRGGSCQGVAFRVAAPHKARTLEYLRERELVTAVYRERTVPLRFTDDACCNGTEIRAVTYIVDRSHAQYAGRLPIEIVERLVSEGVGSSGDNPAYVRNTYQHLRQLDIVDLELEKIVRRLDGCSCAAAPHAKVGLGAL
jgi:cation transport protein ChaC